MLKNLFLLARPWHWVKNAFIVAPVPFAMAAGADLDVEIFLRGFFGFCLINSAIYGFNDLRDRESDRLNPRKSKRPLASGALSVPVASVFIAVLGILGVALTTWSGREGVVALAGFYVVANIIYSMGAKNVALLDVFILSSGFVVRILIGCALVQAPPSNWLLLCSSMLALFLSLAKRRADVIEGMGEEHRGSLAGYNEAFLDQAMGIAAGITLLSYALYSQEAGDAFLEGRELAGLPFVAFGILDYLRMAYLRNAGGNPVEMVYRSVNLQVCVLGWIAATAWSLGLF